MLFIRSFNMLSKERQGEIALAILKRKMHTEGIRVGPQVMREIPSLSKDLNISKDDLAEFFELMVRQMVDETFKKK